MKEPESPSLCSKCGSRETARVPDVTAFGVNKRLAIAANGADSWKLHHECGSERFVRAGQPDGWVHHDGCEVVILRRELAEAKAALVWLAERNPGVFANYEFAAFVKGVLDSRGKDHLPNDWVVMNEALEVLIGVEHHASRMRGMADGTRPLFSAAQACGWIAKQLQPLIETLKARLT